MLAVAGGIAPPAVIGNDRDQVGSIADIPGQKLAVNAFVANSGCYRIGMVGGGQRCAVGLTGIAFGSAAEFFKPGIDKMQEEGEGLDARDEPGFMIDLQKAAAVEDTSGVIAFDMVIFAGIWESGGGMPVIKEPEAFHPGQQV